MLTWKSNNISASGEVVVSALSSTEVIVRIIILDSVLIGVDRGLISVLINIGLVGDLRSWSIGGDNRGGVDSLVSDHWSWS